AVLELDEQERVDRACQRRAQRLGVVLVLGEQEAELQRLLDEDDTAALGDRGEVAVALERAGAIDVPRRAREDRQRVDPLREDQVALPLVEPLFGLEADD